MEDHLVLDLEDRFYKCGFGDENFYQVTWRSRGFEGAYFISNDSLTICIHGALNWDNEPQEIANYLIKESIKLSGLGAWFIQTQGFKFDSNFFNKLSKGIIPFRTIPTSIFDLSTKVASQYGCMLKLTEEYILDGWKVLIATAPDNPSIFFDTIEDYLDYKIKTNKF